MRAEPYDVAHVFGEDVFNDAVMQHRLPKEVYKALRRAIADGTELDLKNAEVIAAAMKDWAMEQGATHYTHWFQPLRGSTAEKHDSFLTAPTAEGKVLMNLSGRELVKGEPDASSFPSGGLRATFEARGYTIWDCSSPAFVRHDEGGATLCIPTAFCSYTGEALDQKTPLLRSIEAVNREALRLIRLLGNRKAKAVIPCVGPEQEYFIIDRRKYLRRTDLIFTGRTLFGAMPPKGQELDDHYFGTLRPRIAAFMKDVNKELWKLGVPAKTQHNEVAPAQHELAVLYENASLAADHNHIVMQTLKRVATRHGLRCLLHEKPFAAVNGSGKHNNWSLATDEGENLFDPGATPQKNLQFLLILSCILKAVDRHADLLRESAGDVGNDVRLGGHEAPPAIISVFLGEQLTDALNEMAKHGSAKAAKGKGQLHTGVSFLTDVNRDETDRNRTSPFAFTGNKFEFRMVGSRDSVAAANTVLNTIAAEAFAEASEALEKAKDRDAALHRLIAENVKAHGRIIFNGNGYDPKWEKEAKKRGLSDIRSMVDAIPAMVSASSVELFAKTGVFTESELHSRAEIKYEMYAKAILVEAKTAASMARRELIPAIMRYQGKLAENAGYTKAMGGDVSVQKKIITEISGSLKAAQRMLEILSEKTASAEQMEAGKKQAQYCRDHLVPAMEALREPIDLAETLVDRAYWPVPGYAELLFEV